MISFIIIGRNEGWRLKLSLKSTELAIKQCKFNAEIIDTPSKKEVIKGEYEWEYKKKGKYEIAIKIIDVLGEEYFEVIKVK